jgi:hypothetical protein
MFPNLQPPLVPLYDPNNRGGELQCDNTGQWNVNGQACNGHYTYVVLAPGVNPFQQTYSNRFGEQVAVWVSPNLHHDDLALGAPVFFAGTLDFAQGVLTSWSNHSGHYQPESIWCDQAPRDFSIMLYRQVQNDGSLAPFTGTYM